MLGHTFRLTTHEQEHHEQISWGGRYPKAIAWNRSEGMTRKARIATVAMFALVVAVHPVCAQSCKHDFADRPLEKGNYDKATLLKMYSELEACLPEMTAQAKTMQPRNEDTYQIGRFVNSTRDGLLRDLHYLTNNLRAARIEDFGNPWEVIYFEYSIKDNLEDIYDAFEQYQDLVYHSMSEAEGNAVVLRQFPVTDAVMTDRNSLGGDLSTRLWTGMLNSKKRGSH